LTPIAFHRWFYKNIVKKKDRGDAHYDAFPTPFKSIVATSSLSQWLDEKNMTINYLKSYDGAKAYQLTTGSALKQLVAIPYYCCCWVGYVLSLGTWKPEYSDILLVAEKNTINP
jgi:hypothetical protein